MTIKGPANPSNELRPNTRQSLSSAENHSAGVLIANDPTPDRLRERAVRTSAQVRSRAMSRNLLCRMMKAVMTPEDADLLIFSDSMLMNRVQREAQKVAASFDLITRETFDFLGFTHCCGTDRNEKFQIIRPTAKKRMRAR